MAGILILKAYEAPTKDYRHTEMWLYLPEEHRPPESLCAMGELDRAARDLFDLRPMDGDHRDRDVGA